MRTKNRVVWITTLLVIVATMIPSWLIFHRRHTEKPLPIPPQPSAQFVLHSLRTDHAVIIPFHTEYTRTTLETIGNREAIVQTKLGPNIFVTVRIGRKALTAMVDTGCADTFWPSRLKLGPLIASHVAPSHDSGGHRAAVHVSVLYSIQIGGLEVRNLPAYATEVPTPKAEDNEYQPDMLQIGDDAFAGLVLTVDYPRKILIVHSAGFPPPKTAFVSPCGWADLDIRSDSGVPSIWSKIEGLKSVGIIDTGWAAENVGISSRVYQKILPTLKRKQVPRMRWMFQGAYGNISCTLIKRVKWSISGLGGETIGCTTPTFLPGQDLILGTQALSHERVTIDYPGKRVWLERETH